jgi:hypothetical protein
MLCFYFCVLDPSYGCSLVLPPITTFDSTEYIFTGQVVSLVGPIESETFLKKAWGLQIRVEEKIYLPQTPAGDFEVFRFRLGADCSMVGITSEELLKYYPLGSRVRVIARSAKLIQGTSNDNNLRLEIVPFAWGQISRNYYEDGRKMADAQSVFDYKSFKPVSPKDYVQFFMPFLDSKVALPDFELRKDLLRLEAAGSRGERVQILRRLLYYPNCCGAGDYYGIAKHYLQDSQHARSLDSERKSLLKLEP